MTTKAKQKSNKTIKVFDDLEAISRFAAEKFIDIGNRAIKNSGRFSIALAGGSTPKPLYELLATAEYESRIDWEKAYFFLGDERDVSPMSEKSNYRMINETMLANLPIPKTNIFRWHTEIINALEVAESYQRTLIKFFELSDGEFPRFDLILLGMGDDGHTASIFPHSAAITESRKLAVANYVEKLDTNRLTLTFPVINNAANVMFLVGGKSKSSALKQVLKGTVNPEKFPSQNVEVSNGNLLWLFDKNSAAELTGDFD